MEENLEQQVGFKEDQTEQPRKLRGLYKKVNISVRTLDFIIVGCIAVIVIVLALNMRNPGFSITFDSQGGTDVSSQKQIYGELLEVPAEPTREGYEFTGWYLDPSCYEEWQFDSDTVESELTLYAGWEAN